MAIRIGRRDRNALLIGGVAVCLFAVVKFAVFPVLDRKETLERTIASQSESLREMMALRTEYEQLVQRSEQAEQRFDRREKGFTLFSFLDRLAGQADIKDSITYMKPSVVNPKNSPYSISQVEMKIQNTTMERLVRYLQLIEQPVNTVSVRRLSITRIERPEARLTAFLLVETPEPTPGPSGG